MGRNGGTSFGDFILCILGRPYISAGYYSRKYARILELHKVEKQSKKIKKAEFDPNVKLIKTYAILFISQTHNLFILCF